MANFGASGFYRTLRNDASGEPSHNNNMARRGDARGRVDWFLKEWMDTLEVRQVDMQRIAGWSKATASQLYTGTQNYSPKVVIEAAAALNVRPYELLMPPDEAMALRRFKTTALQLASATQDWQSEQTLDDLLPAKKSSHKAK